MEWTDYRADPAGLWAGAERDDRPIGFVDAAGLADWPEPTVLPPYPLIGVGSGQGKNSPILDAVIEAPVAPDAILRQVLANPRAAGVVVELLRILPEMSLTDGLTAESLAYATLQGSMEHARWLATSERQAPGPLGKVAVKRDGATLHVALDRARAGNALDRTMRDALTEALRLAVVDVSISKVRLTGTGRTFSLGADLSEFGTTRDPATAHRIRSLTLPARMALICCDRLEVHVQGACVGAGLELAAFAKRITATRDAWFQLPELAMGILPGAGGCVSLTRRIGRQRTALMILSGKRISAKIALEWGLIDAIVDDAA